MWKYFLSGAVHIRFSDNLSPANLHGSRTQALTAPRDLSQPDPWPSRDQHHFLPDAQSATKAEQVASWAVHPSCLPGGRASNTGVRFKDGQCERKW